MTTDDPIELIIAAGLRFAGIRFVHESDNKKQNLDFYLPEVDIYIECKQFPTDRTSAQIAGFPNVIVIQGRRAAEMFVSMLRPAPASANEGRAMPWIDAEEGDMS